MIKPNSNEISFAADSTDVFSVSPHIILPSTWGQFSIYLKQGDAFVLYTSRGEVFSEDRLNKLSDMGEDRVFVRAEDKRYYQEYLQIHLSEVLDDERIPLADRAGALYQASLDQAKAVFERKLPHLADGGLEQLEPIIEACTRFLTNPDALKELAGFLSKGFALYQHCLSTMVLITSLLRGSNIGDDKTLFRCALGAMLHDIGKAKLPEELLKQPERSLTTSERTQLRNHPAQGVSMLASLPLSQETYNCILMHHEREDGKGFPTGVRGDRQPDYVKALYICNRYDGLTRNSPDHPAIPPFQALKVLRDDKGCCDVFWLKRLIEMLAKAEVT